MADLPNTCPCARICRHIFKVAVIPANFSEERIMSVIACIRLVRVVLQVGKGMEIRDTLLKRRMEE